MATSELHVWRESEYGEEYYIATCKDDLRTILREQHGEEYDRFEEEYGAPMEDSYSELPDLLLLGEEGQPESEWKTCGYWCTVYGRGIFGTPKESS